MKHSKMAVVVSVPLILLALLGIGLALRALCSTDAYPCRVRF